MLRKTKERRPGGLTDEPFIALVARGLDETTADTWRVIKAMTPLAWFWVASFVAGIVGFFALTGVEAGPRP